VSAGCFVFRIIINILGGINMSQYPTISLSLSLGGSDYPTSTGANERRMEAFTLYEHALGAKMTSKSIPPNGKDLHITMSVNGMNIMLGPSEPPEKLANNQVWIELNYDNAEALHKTYDILSKEGSNCEAPHSTDWGCECFALVTDKFGVQWALFYN
jgi:uncharacterized glyoxalase superfamily protein PhnB